MPGPSGGGGAACHAGRSSARPDSRLNSMASCELKTVRSEIGPKTAGSRSRVKAPLAMRAGADVKILNCTEEPRAAASVETLRFSGVCADARGQGSVRMPQTKAVQVQT